MVPPDNTTFFKLYDYATKECIQAFRFYNSIKAGDTILWNDDKTYKVLQVSGCDLIVIEEED